MLRRVQRRWRRRLRRCVDDLRDAKVADRHLLRAVIEEYVVRLEVAVHDALGVQVLHPQAYTRKPHHHALERQVLVLLPLPRDERVEVTAVVVVHHNAEAVFVEEKGISLRDDEGMVEAAHHAYLLRRLLPLLLAKAGEGDALHNKDAVVQCAAHFEDDAETPRRHLLHDVVLIHWAC
ncbi:hypothetical protein DQ04_06511070 [Trypanosoma grayi]|uniref:hypothetical protein n=1 Tax=Trypanosoma grayi TaxID=71804 RepID=UPI0004F493D7|nr:hypothetical protein DQ04_06511070 [Trypanosoma grayi]KEG08753.1 hypothetical protein DQ04_06511070 [Trypanosoma grayi]